MSGSTVMFPGNSLTGPDPILQEAELRVKPVARGITPVAPIVHLEKKRAYICTMPNASMHRPDGTRIGFIHGFHETDLKASIEYLDAEIAAGHEYVRFATDAEIEAAHMRLDPVGTMKDMLRPQIEQELRAKLEAEIRAELGMPPETVPVKVDHDAQKLAGSDLLANLRNRLSAEKVPGATLVPVSGGSKLGGIVGSDKIAGMAAGSAGGSGASE